MSGTVFIKGVWYEVGVTECYTYMILRDKFGSEFKFYNDAEGMSQMLKILG